MTQVILDFDQITDAHDILKDKFDQLIQGYIDETESLLFEIDICRSGERDEDIVEIVHQLKSSSFQVGASRVSTLSNDIHHYINDNNHKILSIAAQTQLDKMLSQLRIEVQNYKTAIFEYLQK